MELPVTIAGIGNGGCCDFSCTVFLDTVKSIIIENRIRSAIAGCIVEIIGKIP